MEAAQDIISYPGDTLSSVLSSPSKVSDVTASTGESGPSSTDKTFNDLDGWLSKLSVGTALAESEVKSLCEMAREIFLNESKF